MTNALVDAASRSNTTRRKVASFGRREATDVGIALVVALGGVGVVFAVTPLSGVFGFVVLSIVVFLIALYLRVLRTQGRKHASDRVVTSGVTVAALLAVTPLVMMLYTVVRKGLPTVSMNLFTKTMEGVDPSAPATVGGAKHAIIGTFLQVIGATLVCVPFGIATAIYLNEIRGRLSKVIRLLVDAMSGIPSIVAGLFIYAVWVIGPGGGFSGFSASLALAILMLPTVARTTEEMLRLVDPSLREVSLALGSSQWRTTAQVVLPTARSGIVTAVILGIARIAGETAPLIMTSFGNDPVVGPVKMFSNPQASMPLYILQMLVQDQKQRAWSTALVLIGLVLALFVVARLIGRQRTTRR